jgi:hypothetical protein
MYSSLGHERTLDYADWLWEDYAFLNPPQPDLPYRHSDYHGEVRSSSGVIKFNSRWVFDKLDYCEDGEGIFSDTFGEVQRLSNEDFPGYYFLQRGEVRKALHSSSSQNYALIIKVKLNRVRKDCWENAAFLMHGSLNS